MNKRERSLIQRSIADLEAGKIERTTETLLALCGSAPSKPATKRRKPRSATRKKIGKDPAYLAWLHTLPCCVSSNVHGGRIEAAHLGPRGLSTKVPDRQAVAMCNGHHNGLHLLGPGVFWKKHGQDWQEIIRELNGQYEAERMAA